MSHSLTISSRSDNLGTSSPTFGGLASANRTPTSVQRSELLRGGRNGRKTKKHAELSVNGCYDLVRFLSLSNDSVYGENPFFMISKTVHHIITGGRVIDGTGSPWQSSDVLIADDRIVDVVPRGSVQVEGARKWDAEGMFVCPGFIDIQSHSVASLMRDGRCVSKVTQGITTEIMGELWTPAPIGGGFTAPFSTLLGGRASAEWHERAREWYSFGDWLRSMEQTGVSPNVGSFLSASTLRQYAMAMEGRAPTPEQAGTMARIMSEAMEDGAFGVSYALIYPPENYAATSEIIEVAKVVARYSGLYITHMRSESENILEGLEEALTIGREAGVPVEIYHLKASGKSAWKLMPEVIRRIEAARESGLDVTADMYPYEATGTTLATCLPAWTAVGGLFFDRLRDRSVRDRIRAEVYNPQSGYDGQLRSAKPENIMPVGFRVPEHCSYIGMRLHEIAALRHSDVIDTICDLLAAEGHKIPTLFFKMSEENTVLQLRQPWVTISTDAPGVDPGWARAKGLLHPRSYGTCPRVFRKYVREQPVLTWEEAVRKMTSAVANRLRLRQRGRIEPGYYADLVIFDPKTIADRATFIEPHQLSVGVRDVWINGVPVVVEAKHTGSQPGRFVRP